jgi:hypothetical protein
MKTLNVMIATVVVLLAVPGCRQPAEETGTAWTVVSQDELGPAQTAQREKALAARDAMFTSLKGRLMEVMGSEGPAAAISVCSREAPQIAERISREHGLEIRRTSFRLRNTDNAPPAWAAQLVADRVSEPTYLTQDGKLAALLPIRIQAPCLVCHGSRDTLPAPVKEALSEHYPKDQATGFKEGDLRGWFTVEVRRTSDLISVH